MKRKILVVFSIIFALVGTLAIFSACKPSEDENKKQSGEEVGVYYYDAENTEYLLTLSEECKFTLSLGNGTRSGEYVLEGTALALNFTEGEPTSAMATLKDDALTLNDYNGSSYQFLKKIDYTVKFNTAGGSSIKDVTVVNGKTVAQPADPAKDGSVFIAWYTDSNFLSAYNFTQPVRGNLELYARFVERLDPEFTVSFSVDGAQDVFDPAETIGGKLFDLPTPKKEGAEFAGWWVSQYEDGAKLTYRYQEQQLFEDTTFFAVWKSDAPLVSFTDAGISWSAEGLNNSYTYKLTGPSGVIVESSGGQTSYAYNFAANAEGEYTAEVTLGGKTTTAYYRNKALPRVSVFDTAESVLVWNGIPNADKYLVSYQCGTVGHVHTDVECSEARYSFENCEMLPEGFSFTIKAVADGYVESVSKPFVFERSLSGVTGLSGNSEEDTVTWAATDRATSYHVDVKKGGVSLEGYPKDVTERSIDLRAYGQGEYTVEVTPVAFGWNSPAAATTVFQKTRIATPAGIELSGSTVTWKSVDGAEKYEVQFNGVTYSDITQPSFELLDEYHRVGQSAYPFTVRAIGSSEANNSLFSETFTVRNGEMGELTYSEGVVSWDAVWGVSQYAVKIGEEGAEQLVFTNSFTPTFPKKGDNDIYVCAFLAGGARSEWKKITETAYALYFIMNDAAFDNGSTTADPIEPIYKVYGDPLDLAKDVRRSGYRFNGWYTALTNGAVYNATHFDKTSDFTVFAYWTAEQYTVTLDVGADGLSLPQDKVTQTVTFDQPYELPVPETTNVLKGFRGWFTGYEGTGAQRTDCDGKNITPWGTVSNTVLHAGWVNVLAFTYMESSKGYAVRKGVGIGYVHTVTIPSQYLGKPVVSIEDFSSASNLRVINVPDSIVNITLGTTAVAFRSSNAIEEVNVYTVTGTHEVYYSSDEGVLYYKNPRTSSNDLVYFPAAKEGTYTLKDGTNTITAGAFQYAEKVSELKIPASVSLVETEAFYSIDALTTVTFLPAEEGEEVQPLTLRPKAFSSCSRLTTLTFPNRLAQLPTADETVGGAAALNFVNTCAALATINVDESVPYEDQIYTSENGFLCTYLSGHSGVKELAFLPAGFKGELILPENVVSVGAAAAMEHRYVKGLVVHANFRSIKTAAFRGATGLAYITFQGDQNSPPLEIGQYAFYGCTGLVNQEILLAPNLTKLGAHAFFLSTGLSTPSMTVRVESGALGLPLEFEDGAFANDDNQSYVTKVHLGKSTPAFNFAGVFGTKLAEITVDDENDNLADREGVLFDKKIENIVFYPLAKTGPYVLPDTVTTIGGGVFEGRVGLTQITIGVNVATIGARAFAGCTALEAVIFLSESAGAQAMLAAETSRVELTIGESAFANCSQIAAIVLPENTVEIGSSAFTNCSNLTSVNIPSTVRKMGDPSTKRFDLFDGCGALSTITVETGAAYGSYDGVLYAMNEGKPSELMYAPMSKTGPVDVPASVTNIWADAFKNNTGVTELTFSQGLAGADGELGELEIAANAFSGCTMLSTITLPDGLKKIGENVFADCVGLEEVTIPYTVTSISAAAFKGCRALHTLIFNPTPEDQEAAELRFEDGAMDGGVFSGCTKLKTVDLPERLVYIGNYTFGGTGLTQVNIPAAVDTIGNSAFRGLNLTSVTFDVDKETQVSSLGTIGAYAFNGIGSLTGVEFPEGLITIGAHAFEDSGLTSVKFPGTLRTISENAFNNVPLPEVELNSGLQRIELNAFNNTQLTSVRIPATVQVLGLTAAGTGDQGAYAFRGSPLRTVVFEDGSQLEKLGAAFVGAQVESIDFGHGSHLQEILNAAFSGLAKLKSITLPASLRTIAMRAFENCYALKKIDWEKDENGETKESSLETIGKDGSSSFTKVAADEIDFPKSTSQITIASGAFAGSKFTTVKLSNSVVDIGSGLRGCSVQFIVVPEDHPSYATKEGEKILYNKLESGEAGNSIMLVYGEADEVFTIEEGALEIGGSALFRQAKMKKVLIPASVEKIGNSAFAQCSFLEEVVIAKESNLYEIGYQAFGYCYNLKSINLENATKLAKLTSNGGSGYQYYGAFMNCTSLQSVDLSKTKLKTLQNQMFYNCSSLTEVKLPETLEHFKGELTEDGKGVYRSGGCASCFSGTQITSLSFPKTFKTFEVGNNAGGTGSWVNLALPKTLETIDFGGAEISGQMISFKDYTALKNLYADAAKDKETYGDEEGIAVIPSLAKLPSDFMNGCTSIKKVYFSDSPALESIGINTFANCTSLEFVDMSGATILDRFGGTSGTASVLQNTKAGNFTNCTALKEVILPAGVTRFGKEIFKGCTSLKTVYYAGAEKQENVVQLPADVKCLGESCFASSGIEEIALPALAYSSTAAQNGIGSKVFQNCESLREVTLPEGFQAITPNMFDGCTALEKVGVPGENGPTNALPSSIVFLAYCAFQNCESLPSIDLSSLSIDKFFGSSLTGKVTASTSTYTFAGCRNLAEVKLPGTLTTLGGYSFQNCEKLEKIDLENVDTLGVSCFAGSGITGIDLSKVTSMGTYVFQNCKKLAKVDFGASSKITALPNYTFDGCTVLSNVTLPTGLTSIGTYAFRNDEALTSISLGESLTKIDVNAFQNTKLTRVVIPAKLATIGNYAFQGTNVSTLDFTNASLLTSIGNYAFESAKLSTVDMSGAIKLNSIGESAFANNTLTSVTLPAPLSTLGRNAFEGNSSLRTVDVGQSKFTLYNNWMLLDPNLQAVHLFKKNAQLVDGTVTFNGNCKLSSYMFEGVDFIKKVVLAAGITEIPDYAFYNSNIEEIEITAAITKVGQHAFDGAHFKSVTLPESVTSIGDYAFANSEIGEVILPNGIATIGQYWFSGTKQLQTVAIPATVTKIENYAFQNSSITSLTIPATVTGMPTSSSYAAFKGSKLQEVVYKGTTIGNYAFYGAAELATFTFETEGTFTSIGNSAFYGCTALTSISLPETLTSIGTSAFQNAGLTGDIEIPATLATISASSFRDTQISGLTINNGVTKIDTAAFQGTKLTQLTIPYTVTSIGQGAFASIPTLVQLTFAKAPDGTEEQALTIVDGADNATATNKPGAFEGSGLSTVDIPSRVATIGASAFRATPSLTAVNLPDTLQKIRKYAFFQSGLTEFKITSLAVTIEDYAYSETQIREVVIPEEFTGTLGDGVFAHCTQLTSAKFLSYGADTVLKGSTFAGCSALQTVELAEGITTLRGSSFKDCTDLKTVKLPESLTIIFGNVFENCTSLNVFIPIAVNQINSKAFEGMTEDQTIYFENTAYGAASLQSDSYRFDWANGCKAKIRWDVSYEEYLEATAAPKD